MARIGILSDIPADGAEQQARILHVQEQKKKKAAAFRERHKERLRHYHRERYAANPERYKAASRRWHEQNPEAETSKYLRREYHITLTEYYALVAAQGGVCKLCKSAEMINNRGGRIRLLSVDHDHSTGKIRGLLCHRCNAALGLYKDDPALLRRAADYVEQEGELWQE